VCADEVVREVGVGTFGRVVECVDRKRSLQVAVKVVRCVKKYTESAKIEAEILDDIMDKGGAAGQRLIVQMYNHFFFDGQSVTQSVDQSVSQSVGRSVRALFGLSACSALLCMHDHDGRIRAPLDPPGMSIAHQDGLA
jgi:serine/threonine protein kinase